MRGTIFALVAVAVLAAGGAAFFANRMVSAPRPLPVADGAEVVPAADVLVLVAATDLNPGQPLGPGAMRWQPWPTDLMRPEYVRSQPHRDAPDTRRTAAAAYEGRLARRHIAAGEPLTDTKVFERSAVGFLAGTLDSGKRALSVAVTPESGAGGFVLPGDRVDVILSHDITRSLPRQMQDFGPAAGVAKHAAETVLENLRVLAVDQTVAQAADGQAVVARTATLEVSPHQAQVLALAATMGTLSLSLRSLDAHEDNGDAAVPTLADVVLSPALARAMTASNAATPPARQEQPAVEAAAAPAPAPAPAAPRAAAPSSRWSVSIYRGGVGSTQTVQGR